MIDGLYLHVRTERQVVPQKEVGIEIVGRCSLGVTDDGTVRKAEYITDFAARVRSGAFDLDGIRHRSDEEAIRALTALRGVGVWTAEMILLFCMQRPDVFSYDDLAIQRGLRMIYHHRKIDRRLFEKYRRRFLPAAAWRACICGQRRAAPFRSCGTMRPQSARPHEDPRTGAENTEHEVYYMEVRFLKG